MGREETGKQSANHPHGAVLAKQCNPRVPRRASALASNFLGLCEMRAACGTEARDDEPDRTSPVTNTPVRDDDVAASGAAAAGGCSQILEGARLRPSRVRISGKALGGSAPTSQSADTGRVGDHSFSLFFILSCMRVDLLY